MSELLQIETRLAEKYDVPLAHVRAVVAVESGGRAFTTVNGRGGTKVRFPLCRFEGHLFHRRLSGDAQARAVKAGIASSKMESRGGVKNPAGQQGRYDLLQRAVAIDKQAAYASCSWGVGQVLGSHYRVFGLESPYALYKQAASGLEGQLGLMFDYIVAFDLIEALRKGDWSAFARGYNGPAYRTNRYDTKLDEAAKRFGSETRTTATSGVLRMGATGARVRELQKLLVRAGHAVSVDGDFGPATRTAVNDFQKAQGLKVDGVAGPKTFEALGAFRQAPEENLAATPITEVPNIGKAAGVAAVGGAIAFTELGDQLLAAGKQIGEVAQALTAFPQAAAYVEVIAQALVSGSGIVAAIAGVVGAIQVARSKQTYEGIAAA